MKDNRFAILFSWTKGSRAIFGFAILSTFLSAAFSLIDPLIVRAAIDAIVGGKEMDAPSWFNGILSVLGGRDYLARNLWLAGILLVSFNLVGGAFGFLRGTLSAVAAERSTERLRNRLYRHILDLSYGYHAKAMHGDLVQRSTSDVDTVRRFLATQAEELSRAFCIFAISAVIMFGLDWRMALASLLLVPAIFAYSYVFFKKTQAAFTLCDESESRLTAVLQENLAGIRVVRAFARESHEKIRFDERNREYQGKVVRLIDLLGWYWSVSDLMCMAQTGIVLVVGSWAAATGAISIGTMVVFFAYVGRLLWPVRQMGRVLTELGKALVSTGRIQEILDTEDEYESGRARHDMRNAPDTRDDIATKAAEVSVAVRAAAKRSSLASRAKGRIEFRGVSLEYEKGKSALEGIDLEIEEGETLAILGKTGSGKSSIALLLARLYEPSKGKILLDGIDIRALDKTWVRSQVGLVLQEPFLFSKTLEENIRIARPEAQRGALEEIVSVAGMSSMIEGFEHGYDTAVGEEGVTLSGGQRQRVAIARVLLKDPPILVFDDSLSAVDTETDSRIREALGKRARRRTTIVIAHRISTLAQADRIAVMEHGRIVDLGTHEELAGRDGLYRRIYEMQAGY